MHRRSLLVAAAAVLASSGTKVAWAHDFSGGSLAIGHPWSRATPPGAKVAGGFLEIENRGTADDRLIAVHADISAATELHLSTMTDGAMQMRPLPDGVPIPAGTTVLFQPGGLHVMFVGLLRPLVEGESFAAELEFEQAGRIAIAFAVQAAGSEGGHGHSQ